MYFHGNAEDLSSAEHQMCQISNYLGVAVIALEYPSYGLYRGNGNASEAKVKEDAEYLYKFLLSDANLAESDILVFGRSMGSGPACWLAGNYNPGALMIMSGYTSIKGMAKEVVGFLKVFISERFDNYKQIAKAKCPTWILHGR